MVKMYALTPAVGETVPATGFPAFGAESTSANWFGSQADGYLN
jgi:hypothetical protein